MLKGCGALFVVAFLLPLLFFGHCSDAIESDPIGVPTPIGKDSPAAELSSEKMGPPDFGKGGEEEKKTKDQDGGSGEGTKKGPEKDDSRESPGERKDNPLADPKEHEKNGKGSSDGGSDAKTLPVEDFRVEECDPSNRCIDDKNKFVACLRVPGKDSLALSLLIQNKGTGTLDVNIVAPDFVTLEQNIVQLKAKEDKEVKVSVRDGTNDTMIVLKAGDGNCSLDFHNMISNSIKGSETSALHGYMSLSTRSSFICIFLVVGVLIGVAWLCVRFREGSPKYQKVEVGLPVSTGGKQEADEADGWDNSWGDGWDDEEAPKTPSKPVSNPSSKGLASRRSNRDGWKD